MKFPLEIIKKEDHPKRLEVLEGVDPKYYETAEEINLKKNAIDYLYKLITAVSNSSVFSIIKTGEYKFKLTAENYLILNNWYSIIFPQEITLENLPTTPGHLKVFLFYADNEQQFGVIEGGSGIAAVPPTYNATTQFPLGYVIVSASESGNQVVGYDNITVFDEGGEWNVESGVITSSDSSNGNNSVETTSSKAAFFSSDTDINFKDLAAIKLAIRVPSNTVNSGISIYFNQDTATIGSIAVNSGYNESDTNWQQLEVDLSNLNYSGETFNAIGIVVSGVPLGNKYKIDEVVLTTNSGISLPPIDLIEIHNQDPGAHSNIIQSRKRLVSNDVSGTYKLDFLEASDWKLTLTGATTLEELNTPVNSTAEITLKVTGEFPITLPVNWSLQGDDYNGSIWNFFAVQIHNESEATCFISNLE